VQIAVDAGCDSVEHGFFMGSENLRRMADQGVVWVPTAFTMGAYAEQLPPDSLESQTASRNLDHQLEQMSLARELGVPVALGTDSGSLGVGHGTSLREEMTLLMRAGYGLEEAVHCATERGARLLGLEDVVGRLRPGMPATFLVLDASPSGMLDGLARPPRVFVNGRELDPP
jgi:imidazolonepropionase-like amidohydrolase